jgi:hypothetical protein
MLAPEPSQRFQNWSEVATQLTQAGSLVARRDAASVARPPPPPERVAPAAEPTLPHARIHRAVWITVVLLALGIPASIIALKKWVKKSPALPVAVVFPPPAAATPLASPPPSPVATPAPVAAAGGFDWRAWSTVALEAAPGAVKPSAEIDRASGALRLFAAGVGLGGENDECGFHFRPIEGNWIFSTHLIAHDGAAGLSVRDSASSGGAGLTLWLTRDGAVATAVRKKAGAPLELNVPVAAKNVSWLRLGRRGAVLIAESSVNGKQWKRVAKLEGVPISPSPAVGFVVWSGTKERPATAVFDRISLTSPR